LINASGDIVTLQAINADGAKDFLAGGEKSGAFYPMTNGKLDTDAPILIGEGIATLWAAKHSTGYQGIAAMDAGNLLPVARSIREKAPNAKIILIADNDIHTDGKPNTGVLRSIEAAKAIGGYVAIPELPSSQKCDCWDLWYESVSDGVKAMIANATDYSTPQISQDSKGPKNNAENLAPEAIKPDPFMGDSNAPPPMDDTTNTSPVKKPLFTSLSEMKKNRKSVPWLIRDYLPMDSTAALLGESGAGKSFLMIDMALCVATGKEWHGHKTKQGAVFYVIGEGQSGITARCEAWEIHSGITTDDSTPFFCTEGAILLPDKGNLIELMSNIDGWIKSTGQRPALIVFDTLARCFIGEENSAKDTGAYIQSMDTLRRSFGCCVVNVHHTGKDATKGGRGSSALKGAWDMELCLHNLHNQGDLKRLEMTKSKETANQPDKFFNLELMTTNWTEEDGRIIYSAVMVESIDAPLTNSGARVNLKPNDEKVLSSLSKSLNDNGIDPPQAIKDLFTDTTKNIPLKVVNIDYWRTLAYQSITVLSDDDTGERAKSKGKQMAFRRSIEKLERTGLIGLHSEYAWNGNGNRT
jgi:hypothetical protein